MKKRGGGEEYEYGSGGEGEGGGRGEARKESASTGVLRRDCISMTVKIKEGYGVGKEDWYGD